MSGGALAEAQRLYGVGDLAASETQFRLALEEPGSAAAALYGLGMIRYSREDRAGASTYLHQSLDEEPRNPHALYYLGNLAAQEGKRDAAVSLYARALTIDPQHAATLVALTQMAQAPSAPEHAPGHVPQPQAPASATPSGGGVVHLCGTCGSAQVPGAQFCDRCGTAYGPSHSAPPAAGQPSAGRPPRPPQDSSSLVGIVAAVQQRVEAYRGRPASITVLDLRVETGGSDGPVEAVHMRGMELRGSVTQGDWVEVPAKSRTSDGYRPKRIRNLTTGSVVEAKSRLFLA